MTPLTLAQQGRAMVRRVHLLVFAETLLLPR
jgi:hypothetical protein